MKVNVLAQKIGFGFLFFCILTSSSFALRLTDLSDGKTEDQLKGLVEETVVDPAATRGLVTDIREPVIEAITIQNNKETDGASLALHGKELLPTNGRVTVSFVTLNGQGSVSAFSYSSKSLLLFPLPKNVISGDVVVSATGENQQTKKSKPFYFEYHPPEILFVTGKDGFGPGKTIQVWGNYFDGVYFRDGGKSKMAEMRSGVLKGGDDVSVKGNLSMVELTLPIKNYNKKFWIERNCDAKGENCLKSNEIDFSSMIHPLITELQIDYQNWEGTLYGENFPEDESVVSLTFGDKRPSLSSYSSKENKLTFPLPCPLPGRAVVRLNYKTIKSNPLLFVVEDAPVILSSSVAPSENIGTMHYEVSVNERLDIPKQSQCTKDRTIFVGGREYALRKYGGKYLSGDVSESAIPASANMSVVFQGIESNIIPFEKKKFTRTPHIYRIESKYGFRPGAPFQIFGRNFGNSYKSCDSGVGTINGPAVYSEDRYKVRIGTDSNGDPIYDQRCDRIPPTVKPERIDAQFASLAYGERTGVSDSSLSFSISGVTSNSLKIHFGDKSEKIVQAAPEISAIEYPEGHLPGDHIILRGNEFGKGAKHNVVSFGNKKVLPVGSNNRGTELTVKIPKGAKSGSITVFRKTPHPQTSSPYEVIISPHPEKKAIFSFAEKDDAIVELEDAEKPFSFPAIKYVNSIGDLQVNNFRLEIKWVDGDPEDIHALKNAKIPPFGVFTLKRNGEAVSEQEVAHYSGKNITLNFPPFVIPLTQGESDSLTVETTLLPFATKGSKFQMIFSPQKKRDLTLLNIDSNTGIYAQPKESISSASFTIHTNAFSTCIDVDTGGTHCREYDERIKQNQTYSQSKKTSKTSRTVEKTLSRREKVEQILARQQKEKERRVREIFHEKEKTEETRIKKVIENKSEKLLTLAERMTQKYGKEKGNQILSILQKQHSLSQNRMKGSPSYIREQNAIQKAKDEEKKIRQKIVQKTEKLYSRLRNYRRDSDRDGLTDAEELLMGTDPDRTDTDRDGYSDFIEVEFGISPLEKNPKKIFSDISSAGTAASEISRLYFLGILDGFSDGTFRPNDSVTRSAFVVFVSRIFSNPDTSRVPSDVYQDVTRNDWFASDLIAAEKSGIDIDIQNNSFRPYQPITRQVACEMISPFLSGKVKDELVYEDVDPKYKESMRLCLSKKILHTRENEEGEMISGGREDLTRAEMAVLLYRTIFAR